MMDVERDSDVTNLLLCSWDVHYITYRHYLLGKSVTATDIYQYAHQKHGTINTHFLRFRSKPQSFKSNGELSIRPKWLHEARLHQPVTTIHT